jgi:hypothetical protein
VAESRETKRIRTKIAVFNEYCDSHRPKNAQDRDYRVYMLEHWQRQLDLHKAHDAEPKKYVRIVKYPLSLPTEYQTNMRNALIRARKRAQAS